MENKIISKPKGLNTPTDSVKIDSKAPTQTNYPITEDLPIKTQLFRSEKIEEVFSKEKPSEMEIEILNRWAEMFGGRF